MGPHLLLFASLIADAGRLQLIFDTGRRVVELVGVRMYLNPSFLWRHPDVHIVALFGDGLYSAEHEQVSRTVVENQSGSFSFLYRLKVTSGQTKF